LASAKGLLLRALALAAQGHAEAARGALRQAVELAQPGGFIRLFVDPGPGVQALLRQLAGEETSSEAIQRILAAFPDAQSGSAGEAVAQPAPRSLKVAGLVESLTTREREILLLLREPLSGKEIANRLFISPQPSNATAPTSTASLASTTAGTPSPPPRRWASFLPADSRRLGKSPARQRLSSSKYGAESRLQPGFAGAKRAH
jgi:hypothetical protein